MKEILYISDLHIGGMESSQFEDFNPLVDRAVQQLELSLYQKHDLVLILGDISNNLDLNISFLAKIDKINKSAHNMPIVYVLGNHEFWPFDNLGMSVDEVVESYRERLSGTGIIVLNNDLLLIKEYEKKIIKQSDLVQLSKDDLIKEFQSSDIKVLGGVGFSGENPSFNATNGMYGTTVPSLYQDKKESAVFNSAYRFIKEKAPKENIIVATHTPKTDWSTDDYNPHFAYFSGHTHHNTLHESSIRKVYANNQIGYNRDIFDFKLAKVSFEVSDYEKEDSYIKNISSEEYGNILKGRGFDVADMNLDFKKIICIKSGLAMMFVSENYGKNILILDKKIRIDKNTKNEELLSLLSRAEKERLSYESYRIDYVMNMFLTPAFITKDNIITKFNHKLSHENPIFSFYSKLNETNKNNESNGYVYSVSEDILLRFGDMKYSELKPYITNVIHYI